MDGINVQSQAACYGQTALFFANDGNEPRYEKRMRISRAMTLCNSCPIQAECLQVAIVNNEHDGIWGGVNFDDAKKGPSRVYKAAAHKLNYLNSSSTPPTLKRGI